MKKNQLLIFGILILFIFSYACSSEDGLTLNDEGNKLYDYDNHSSDLEGIAKVDILDFEEVNSSFYEERSNTSIVNTTYGQVEGIFENDVFVFKGIPYAAPPIGNLRFHSPQPPESWDGVRSAKKFGPICTQMPLLDTVADFFLIDYETECEDCLYLNIWTPAPDNQKRPVMVWIHGGAFFWGSGSQTLYHGDVLSANGNVVVVTFNYRLGALGNLTHPDLEDENGYIGNWGMLDMIAALRWVKENIEYFGGDPDNVTIFGESAGSWAVSETILSWSF